MSIPLASQTSALLLVALGSEWWGLPIEQVRSVEPAPPMAPVPGAPAGVRGVFNLRGNLVAALDSRALLQPGTGAAEGDAGRSSMVVVVEIDGVVAGLLVDDIDEVVTVPAEAIEPGTVALGRVAEGLRGVVWVGERLVAVIDPSRLLQALVRP